MVSFSENSYAMSFEPVSPELALVDPELRARARATLPEPVAAPRAPRSTAPEAPARAERPYPFWARVTAALWLLVLGILIGGAAIPHAQDTPRVIPTNEDATATVCKPRPAPLPNRPFPPGT
jgi:hypothetical protein